MDDILKRLDAYYHAFLKIIPRIGIALIILIVGILVANWLTSIIRRKIIGNSHDPLMGGFLAKAIKLVLFIVIILLTLHVAGLSGIAGALLATAGASAIVLGFAFKDIAENFLAGIILAFSRPFHVNDTIKIDEIFGKVKDMQFRYTKITTFDGRNVYIPNSDVLTKPVYNYTEDGYYRSDFMVGIAYENDSKQAKILIQQCLEQEENVVHEDNHLNFVVEDELAASTVNLKVFFWVHTADFRKGMLETRGRLIEQVKTVLEANGFNLPADIKEIKFYNESKPIKILMEHQDKEES